MLAEEGEFGQREDGTMGVGVREGMGPRMREDNGVVRAGSARKRRVWGRERGMGPRVREVMGEHPDPFDKLRAGSNLPPLKRKGVREVG